MHRERDELQSERGHSDANASTVPLDGKSGKMSRKRRLSDRCRICLVSQGCMSDLFDERIQPKLRDLAKCTSIDIRREDDLPSIVCHVCLYKLDMWSEFKEQFVQSNQVLLGQLEMSENSDGTIAKRKQDDLQQSGEDSLSDNDVKKSKPGIPPLIPLEFANMNCMTDKASLKEICISEDDPASSKDSFQRVQDTPDSSRPNEKEGNERTEHKNANTSLVPVRVKSLSGRKGRTTERRKASTKRWVARKKALLAATGETVSDTDSMASDDVQLSPVQKARAKSNAEKEAERQKRLAKALKNLETNMTGKYRIKHDSESIALADKDSELIRTRSKTLNVDDSQNENANLPSKEITAEKKLNRDKPAKESSMEKENSPVIVENNVTNSNKRKRSESEETFTPHSVKSKLDLGDATYIITSTLVLVDKDNSTVNNTLKDCKGLNIDESSQEKNTDIIDAVQLRRVHPVTNNSKNRKYIEKCLNIEVEGTEVEALKRTQFELAGFIEKEMKRRLFGSNKATSEYMGKVCKSSYETLDEQLKSIVEKAIKKNFESSIAKRSEDTVNSVSHNSRAISPTFVKNAMTSKKYQPKVLVKRLNITKESKSLNINNAHVLQRLSSKGRLSGPFSMVARKRQSVQPIKFNDYTINLDSDSDVSDDIESESSKAPNNTQTREASSSKRANTAANSQTNAVKPIEETKPDIKPKPDTNAAAPTVSPKTLTTDNEQPASSQETEKHVCKTCSQIFGARKELDEHAKVHKSQSTRQNKHKMMRCKRCHEIVEARLVKSHVCKTTKLHKCYVCNSTFRTEKLLVRHLESHDQSEFKIENVAKPDSKEPESSTPATTKEAVPEKEVKTEEGEGNEVSQSERVPSEKPKKTYTCFVCDKIFTDEEVLKDHLQKHCDDVSEDDQVNEKERYQCAICGDSLDSEDALEAHVEKHLFDDEDDNPNLISIGNENEKEKEHCCLQCSEVFNSEMLLEMHMQAHEEEAAIAEWEKQGMKAYEYQCMICDELFETEEELSEHLDVHNGNAHVCQLCEKPLPSLEALQQHVATH